MAERADGSIIVDTEIDTEGFKAGSNKIQKAISSMNSKMKNLGPTFQKALSGSASAMSSFDAKATVLESTISEIETELQKLGSAKVPTDTYAGLIESADKCGYKLDTSYQKQKKMKATGVSKNS